MKKGEGLLIEAGAYALRHGFGTHNRDGVIASRGRTLQQAHLTGRGVREIEDAAARSPFNGFPVTVFTSPAPRCQETAMVFVEAADLIVPRGIQVVSALQERDMGPFLDGGSKRGYGLVYSNDLTPDNRPYDAESTGHVAERIGNLLADNERLIREGLVIYVTHADVGEIGQALTEGHSPNTHRVHVAKLRTGELRQLVKV